MRGVAAPAPLDHSGPPAGKPRASLRVSGCLKDRPYRFAIEPTPRGLGVHLLGGGARRERRTVRPFLGHRLVSVGGGEHAGAAGIIAAVAWR